MHRLIWGIVIAVFGVLSFIGAGYNPQGPAGSIIVGLLCVAGRGTMIFFGAGYLSRRKTVTEFALQMLRADDKINAGELAQRIGISEIEIRKHLVHTQRKGIIPFKADIV
jgi:hypothetical protein